MRRFTVIGIVKKEKEQAVWQDGALDASERIQVRHRERLTELSPEDVMENFNKVFSGAGTREALYFLALERAFDEVLDSWWEGFPPREELQELLEAWNKHGGKQWTIEDLEEMKLRESRNHHFGPPYSWEEIEPYLDRKKRRIVQGCIEQLFIRRPKCVSCLKPMEQIGWSSPPWTWQNLCGRAGQVFICRKCKTWRKATNVLIS